MSLEENFCLFLKQGHFKELMFLWRQQKERLGRLGGTIEILITKENQEDLEGLLGKVFNLNQLQKITWKQFEKAISKTKFEQCDFDKVLDLYFQTNIIGKAVIKQEKEEQFITFIQSYIDLSHSQEAKNWLNDLMIQKNNGYLKIKKNYEENINKTQCCLKWVIQALEQLPILTHQNENIAIFASRITGDPHAFDFGNLAGDLLINAISYILKLSETTMKLIEKNELLARVGLDKDGVSNYCMISGINAYQKDNQFHLGWYGFYQSKEIWNINVLNLRNIERIDPLCCQKVIVIENPSVFQFLHAKLNTLKEKSIGLVCTNGQLNYCGYALLDEICKSNIPLYYCGDMDPEGLLIAERLKQRYQKHLHLWHYENEDYQLAKSNKYASEKRCQMLTHIQTPQLKNIANQLCLHQPIGYQENLLSHYLVSLQKM